MVRRLIGEAIFRDRDDGFAGGGSASGRSAAARPTRLGICPIRAFPVTDGRQVFTLTLIEVPDTQARLVMALGTLPPRDQDLWIVRTAFERATAGAAPHPPRRGDLLRPRHLCRHAPGPAADRDAAARREGC